MKFFVNRHVNPFSTDFWIVGRGTNFFFEKILKYPIDGLVLEEEKRMSDELAKIFRFEKFSDEAKFWEFENHPGLLLILQRLLNQSIKRSETVQTFESGRSDDRVFLKILNDNFQMINSKTSLIDRS